MNKNRFWRIPVKILLTVSVIALGFTGCNEVGTDEPVAPQPQRQMMLIDTDNPGIRRAMEVQDRYTSALMRLDDDVVGTATSVDEDGTPVVLVLTNKGTARDLPTVLEGLPVRTHVVGEIVAYQQVPTPNAKGGKPGPPQGGSFDPTKRQSRPVPIGVSTGNINECASGTIGCRVKFANETVGVLSNNHVFARKNQALIGEDLMQPGRYDIRCRTKASDAFATLYAFYPIAFNNTGNTMDAAVGLSSTASVGNATPWNGYGIPSSTTVTPALNMAVQKYGRTTSLTKGTVTAINATVGVMYSGNPMQPATFVNQIIISPGTFSDRGDSGSLIVTDDANANPVGLLFAGSSSSTIASPIAPILNYFGVVIDGK